MFICLTAQHTSLTVFRDFSEPSLIAEASLMIEILDHLVLRDLNEGLKARNPRRQTPHQNEAEQVVSSLRESIGDIPSPMRTLRKGRLRRM